MAMAALADEGPRRLVVNDLLCYAVNKLTRLGKTPVKTTVVDFYPPDEISIAKEKLYAEIEILQIEKFPKMVRRRKDLANRQAIETEDILAMLTQLDEAKARDRLPLFVSSDPDKMPSAKLGEGDLKLLLLKLGKMEDELHTVKILVENSNASSSLVYPTNQGKHSNQDSTHPVFAKTGRVNTGVAKGLGPATESARLGLESDSDIRTSEIEEVTDDGGPWTEMGRRKRLRQHSSPSHVGRFVGESYSKVAAAPPSQRPAQPAVKSKLKALVGASATSKLQAAKTLQVPKAVFFLGNIDSSYTVNDIETYLLELDIRTLTCFELKPRENQPEDNKSFRVCIIAEDKNKLFNRDNWPVGVTLREWRHKPKDENEGGGGRTEGRQAGGGMGEVRGTKGGGSRGDERTGRSSQSGLRPDHDGSTRGASRVSVHASDEEGDMLTEAAGHNASSKDIVNDDNLG